MGLEVSLVRTHALYCDVIGMLDERKGGKKAQSESLRFNVL